MRTALALVLLLAASPVAADELAPKPRPRVIQVLDAATGKGLGAVELRGVSPEADEWVGKSNAEGAVKVPKVPAGWEFLELSKAGYGTVLVDVEDVEAYFAGPPYTYSKHFDGFAGVVKLEADRLAPLAP